MATPEIPNQLKTINLFNEEKFKDKDEFIGQKFTRLTVKSFAYRKNRQIFYVCECECGEISVVAKSNLLKGNTKSCGCLNRDRIDALSQKPGRLIDISGQKFGKLTAIKPTKKTSRGELFWLFKCECGGEIENLGRRIRSGQVKQDCGCVAREKKERLLLFQENKKKKFKPRDNEQYAKDLYCCYIVEQGLSVRDAAIEEGYKTAASFTTMFSEYIYGYREASKKRREESFSNRYEIIRAKKSNKFRYESDFQKYCINKLENKGVCCIGNDRETTGFEIDIKTNLNCYELKITSRHKDLFTALGQLITNHKISELNPVLLIPSDIEIHTMTRLVFEECGVSIQTEKDL